MAAAAALSRSRGAAGVRTTKGLFFIFTLLCLLCFASSQMDKKKLEYLMERLLKSQQDLDIVKAERVTSEQLMSYSMSLMDPLTALVKQTSEALPDGFLENIKGFVKETKTYVDELNEELDARIENTEQKLEKYKKLIEYLEEQQAEL